MTPEDGDEDGFGRCYECKADNCVDCIGVPCQCACPGPGQIERIEQEIADLEQRLAEKHMELMAATTKAGGR